MSDDSYKDAPQSLAERKAHQHIDCSLWQPRDLLIRLLRSIDNGEKVKSLMVLYVEELPNEKFRSVVSRAQYGMRDAIAALEIAKFDLLKE